MPMMKQRFFVAILATLLATLVSPASYALDIPHYRGVVLLYHHVSEQTPAITSISPADFERQLDFLEENEFEVWPLPKLIASLQVSQPIPDKVVAISFDDNYESVYTEAFPRLRARGWPFTVFVSTDAMDKGINMQSSWEQLREMVASGATVANHSASHAHLLAKLPAETHAQWLQRIGTDLARAQQRIEQNIGTKHRLFAYPYGEFNPALAQRVTELGYIGIGQQSGPLYSAAMTVALPRFPFAGNYTEIDDFALKVLSIPLPVIDADYRAGPLPFDEQHPTLVLTLEPGDYNPQQLRCYGSGQGLLALEWLGDWKVKVKPGKAIPVGRSRFNCTVPSRYRAGKLIRYHWYTHPWIRLSKDGQLTD